MQVAQARRQRKIAGAFSNRIQHTAVRVHIMRNSLRILIWISLWLVTALPLMAEDVTVNVEANRNQIYLGESFILQINVAGTGEAEPDLSQVKNCRTRSLGKQNISNYSISFVNGQVTRQGFSGLVISYEITPLIAGPFRAGPVIVNANGQSHKVEGPALTVTDIEKQDLVRLAITSSSETVLIDESFDITLTVLIKRLSGKFADAEPIFPDNPPVLTIPWLSMEKIPGLNGTDLNQLLNKLLIQNHRPGFAINDYMRQPDPFDFSSFMAGGKRPAVFRLDRRLTSRDNQAYVEYYLKLNYSPVDEGNYVFGPVVFKGSVPVEADDTGKGNGMAIFAVGPACTVRVIPPPELDRPACFSGAIGSNLLIKASLDTNACSVGDPLKLTLELTGRVRFDKMLPPKLTLQTNLLEHFTIYDNTVQTIKQDPVCRYIYTLRPKHAGAFQVPPIEVAYYDVKSRGYKTIATQMIPLAVKRGTEITASQMVGNTNRAQIAARTDDDRIQPIAPARTDAMGMCSAPLFGKPAWLVVAGAGPGLFLIGLMIKLYRTHNKKHKAARRRQQAMPRAWRRLNKAIKLGAHSSPAAAAELCAAVRQYLAERLDVAAAGITPADARHLLASIAANPPNDPAGELCRLFEHYFNAGFATRTEQKNLDADCRKLKELIREIELALRAPGHRRANATKSLPVLLVIGSLWLFAGTSAMALDLSERTFIWNEANARMATARTPDAYLRTAQTYQKLVDDGVRNGPLFYNLGTALLQAGQVEPAIGAFQRAEQFLGAQADIRQNLKIAMARKANNETAEWPWHRLVLFWHFYLPAATRLLVTVIAFLIFWVALTLRMLGIKPSWVNALLILATIAVILFGSSTVTTWHKEAMTSGSHALR